MSAEERTPETAEPSIPAGARIGHIHLKVADLDRAIDFYHEVMGFDLITRYKNQAAFLSAGGYHHHIGLNTWESKDGTPPGPGTTGLYHFCINYPDRRDLAAALKRILDHGWGIDGASDHGTHEAIYMHDKDMNGMELAWDRDPSHWYRNGEPVFERNPLDFPGLLAELNDPDVEKYLPGLEKYD